MTRKWIEVNDSLIGQFSVNKDVRFKTPIVKSDLCDYSNAYIVVQGRITVDDTDDTNKRNKKLAFKNNDPFRSCTLKINNKLIDNIENLDIIMPMYNLLNTVTIIL